MCLRESCHSSGSRQAFVACSLPDSLGGDGQNAWRSLFPSHRCCDFFFVFCFCCAIVSSCNFFFFISPIALLLHAHFLLSSFSNGSYGNQNAGIPSSDFYVHSSILHCLFTVHRSRHLRIPLHHTPRPSHHA